MNRAKTRDAAFGRWGSILGHLGLSELIDGKHQDCQLCSAKKKFRYTDYKSNGEWICTCGQGDGFDLLMGLGLAISFKEAAKLVDRVIGNNDFEETFKPEVDYEKRRRDLNALWIGAQDDSLVRCYLSGRGIDDHETGFKGLKDLRGHSAMYNSDIGKRQAGMCALIRNKRGEPVSIHRTFFDPKAKKIMPPTEKIVGAGVRLGWFDGMRNSLVVGEGIETTVAGMSSLRVPGLAAISAHGMENLHIPKEFESVAILADNDRSFTGQKAAFTLARRLDAEKRKVIIYMPNERGTDILDSGLLDRDILQWTNYE